MQLSDLKKRFEGIFRSPTIPEEAVVKLCAAGAMNQVSRAYSNHLVAKMDRALYIDTDRTSRAGLRYVSMFLLVAEILSKSFLHVGSAGIFRKDTGAVVTLLGPLSRLVFDQFARVAVKSLTERRGIVLDSLAWPSATIKKSFSTYDGRRFIWRKIWCPFA